MATSEALPTKTSTRILTLDPGPPADPISASLAVADLAGAHPSYEAISYTWGSPGVERSIVVDGIPVQVRKHLHECLLRLRSTTKPRRLWCDYLCINQIDLKEKAHQVQIIGSIFASATAVLVWLGEHANDSEQLFHDWYQPPESEHYLKGLKQGLVPDAKRKAWNSATKAAEAQRAWQWVHFWQRPYWRRTWIVQELRLSRNIIVHIGPDSMNWKDLISARFGPMGMYASFDCLEHDSMSDKGSLNDPHQLLSAYLSWQSRLVPVHHEKFSKAPGHVIMDEWEGQYGDIFSLVGIFKHSFCYDRRDKVYALHSLEDLSKTHRSSKPVKVDYTLSLPELVLSLLEDRYVHLPPETSERRRLKGVLSRLGVSDKTADSALETLSTFEPNKGVPRLDHLLETLDFKLEDCHTLAKLALEKCHEAQEPYARRYKRISETIISQFKDVAREKKIWDEQKARWDAGKGINLTVTHAPPSFNEDKFWHVHAKHVVQSS